MDFTDSGDLISSAQIAQMGASWYAKSLKLEALAYSAFAHQGKSPTFKEFIEISVNSALNKYFQYI